MHRVIHLIRRAALGVPLAVLIVAVGVGSAAATTGATFVLGHVNTTTHVSTLTNTAGTALSLQSRPGHAPLRVNSSVKVAHLNAALLDGLSAHAVESHARAGLVTAWQVVVGKDGAVQDKHAGVSVAHNSSGDYSLVWVGFPGAALPYCSGLGRAGVVDNLSYDADGSGSARINFNGVDTAFSCALLGLG